MAAIRRQTVLNYAAPRFLRDWISRPWILPLSMLIPAILLVLALLVRDPLGNALGFAPHRGAGMEYANLFPHWLLIAFFTFFLGLAVLLGVLGVIRFWKAMAAADAAGNRGSAERSILSSLVRVAIDIVAHSRFTICRNNPNTRSAHLTAFYGFWALFLVSAWAVILLYVLNPFLASDPFLYPFPFWNPAKVIANLGALALVAGAVIAIRDRSKDGPEIGHSSAFDWWFLWTLLAVGVTGILTEVMRFAQAESAGYVVYFVHLVLAFTLLTYLPYSKFAHIFYRTAAMVYAEHRGRRPHSTVQPQAK